MIKRIQIQNYKSLRAVDVELDPLTVLIGRSGTGKSNFVSAIRFLRDCLTARNFSPPQDGGWANILSAPFTKPFLSFRIIFSLTGIEGDFDYELMLGLPPNQNLREQQVLESLRGGRLNLGYIIVERLKIGDRTLFSQENGKWNVAPKVAQQPPLGTLALGIVYGIPEVQLAYQFLTRGIGCYDFPSDVLQRKVANNGTPLSALKDNGSNYLHTFGAIADDLSDLGIFNEIVAAVRKLSSTVKSIELETQNRSEILVGHQIHDSPVLTLNLTQQSEGLRRFLAHLLALYQTPRKQVLIFEEPEKGIYPGALNVLADYFINASQHQTQVLLTTHNPLLLDYLPVDSMRVVEIHDYGTNIGRLAEDQVQNIREHLMKAGELLTVEEARIQSADVTGPVVGK